MAAAPVRSLNKGTARKAPLPRTVKTFTESWVSTKPISSKSASRFCVRSEKHKTEHEKEPPLSSVEPDRGVVFLCRRFGQALEIFLHNNAPSQQRRKYAFTESEAQLGFVFCLRHSDTSFRNDSILPVAGSSTVCGERGRSCVAQITVPPK